MQINYDQLRQQERLIRQSRESTSFKDEQLFYLAMKYINDQDLYSLDDYIPKSGQVIIPRQYLWNAKWNEILFGSVPQGDLDEAMRIKDLITDPVLKEELLQMIAISYLKQNNHEQAMLILDLMSISRFKEKLIELIGVSCANTGKIETAKLLSDLSKSYKENILIEMVRFCIGAGNLKEAKEYIDLMEHAHHKDEFLVIIGNRYFQQGNIGQAFTMYHFVEKDYFKYWPLARIVIHYIKEKNLEAAEEVFKTIEFTKLDALFEIIIEYIKGGYFEQAKNASKFPPIKQWNKQILDFEMKPMQSDKVLLSLVQFLLEGRTKNIKIARQVYKLIDNPQHKKKVGKILEQLDQKQFQKYITAVQADKSFLEQLKAIQNIDDKKQHLRLKYNFQSNPAFDEYLKAYLQQGIQSFNKMKQFRRKKNEYFADRKTRRLPIFQQQKQSEQQRISIISRIESSLAFLEMLKAQPNLHENSVRFIHDVQLTLIEANNILSANPEQYYKRKNFWIDFLKKRDIYLHDDISNKSGFLDNVYNILDTIEKLQEKQSQQVKKLTSRINPGCIDGKIDALRRYLLSTIDTELPFLATCGNLISEAITAFPEGTKKMSKIAFINALLRRTDIDELLMILEIDIDYRQKAAKELTDVLGEPIVQQNLIARTPQEKMHLVGLIVDALLKISLDINAQGQILFG